MTISLGTTSEAKRSILEEALKLIGIKEFIINPQDVDSEITDQPLSQRITIQGAINRARNALTADETAEIGLGLEAGLEKINDLYYLVCVAAIQNTAGDCFIGVSGKVALPKEVSDGVDRGGEFSKLIRDYKDNHTSDLDLVPLLDRLINRDHDFKESIQNVFSAFNSSKY